MKMSMPLTYVVMGREVMLDDPYHRAADPSKIDLGARWALEVQKLVDEGRLKCHPVREVPGKWQGIIQGLNMLKDSQVRGQKLVVRV